MRAIVQSRFVARQSKFRRYKKWNLIRRAILERKKRRSRCTEYFSPGKNDQRGDIDDRPHARPRIVVRREDSLGNDEREPSDRTLKINFFAFLFVRVLRRWKKRNRRSNRIAVSLFIPRRSNVLFFLFFFLNINYPLVASPIGMINGYACSFHYPG